MSKKVSYSYVSVAFIILVFGIIFVPRIVDRVNNEDITRNDESRSVGVKKNIKSDLSYIQVNQEKRKVPSFSFTNQNGEIITDKDYLGKVYVVEFFFTTCPTICPRMNRNLVEIQNEFENYKDFGVASFTINPQTDTPQVLKAYADTYGILNPNWHLMTGDRDAIYNLARTGFYLVVGENAEVEGGFEHSGNFALIDKEGYIRSRKDKDGNPLIYYNGIISEKEGIDDDGTKQQISILKQDIEKLLNE